MRCQSFHFLVISEPLQGASGGDAAINDFFGHLDEDSAEFMLLGGMTSVSPCAIVTLAHYL